MDAFYSLVFFVLLPLSTIYLSWRIFSYNRWEKFGVPCLPNRLPFFGHMLPAITGKMNIGIMCDNMYKTYVNTSMCGFYFMYKPALLIRDPELVKAIFLTDFSKFQDNGMVLDPRNDPLLCENPFFSTGELWKTARTRMIGNFSTNNLRQLHHVIDGVCSKMQDFVQRKIDAGETEFELKDFFSRCTGEVVANAALGIEGQSFEDSPAESSFTVLAKTLFVPSFGRKILQTIRFFLPEVANFLGVSLLPPKMNRYFRKIIQEKNPTSTKQDLDQKTVEAISFFIDVYETTSITLAFFFHHLAQNPSVQQELREEIQKIGDFSYESLKKMTFLEWSLLESLRLSPTLSVFTKICTQKTTLNGCHLEPGTRIFVPATSLHMDARYWPNPEVYDPRRFEDSGKERFAYLPFGEGPRMCVGKRLALVLAKLATATLISNFAVEPSKSRKLETDSSATIAVLLRAKGGVWATMRKLKFEEVLR